jgi:hypothetical protein
MRATLMHIAVHIVIVIVVIIVKKWRYAALTDDVEMNQTTQV